MWVCICDHTSHTAHLTSLCAPPRTLPCGVMSQVDQVVLKALVAQEMPDLGAHFEAVGADLACVCSQWFLCAYVNFLPIETCMRVWDMWLYQKSVAALFQVWPCGMHGGQTQTQIQT